MAKENQLDQGVVTRQVTAQALAMVFESGKNLDDALGQAMSKFRLPENDRRLVHAIAGTVFRHLPQIDAALIRVMAQKRDPKPKILHNVLRVGVAQLLYMEIPDHAAISTTVSAAGSLKLERQKSFVNACLRSVQREKEALLSEPVHPLDRLPPWLAHNWFTHYGEERATHMAEASLNQAPVDITFNELKAPHKDTQSPLGEPLAPWSFRSHESGSQVTSWPGFKEGAWWVQDIAASLPINMLGDVRDKSVLDIGAAPGGKTMQLLTKGARVTALDISASRMTRLSENLARVKGVHPVKTVVADACKWTPPMPFDAIVLDAPCSSTGTLRRHPELPWIRSEKEVITLGMIQRDLLASASKMLAESGLLLYCTCSLQPEEGESQVEAFLADHKDFKEIRSVPEALEPFLTSGLNDIGFRTFPDTLADKGGMDGFFFALLQRQ